MKLQTIIPVLLLLVLELTACAEPVYANPPNVPAPDIPQAPRDFGTNLANFAQSTWDLFGSVGDLGMAVGHASRNLEGMFLCALLPLAGLGVWTLWHLKMILALTSLQKNIRGFFHE